MAYHQSKENPCGGMKKTLAMIEKKRHAYQRYMQTREGKDYLEYAKATNQAKAASRQTVTVQDFEKPVAREDKRNPKAFYSYAKGKMKTREGIADLIDSCRSKASSDRPKAEILNSFFCSVFTEENMKSVLECKRRQCNTNLCSVNHTKESVLKKMKQLNPSKSPGPDGLHPCFLKELAEELAKPLAQLFPSH